MERNLKDLFFIEIGTSYFNTLEHLVEQGWSGIFVEPDNYYISKLKKYSNCFYENSAVLDYEGESDFIAYDAEWKHLEQWAAGMGQTDLNFNNMKINSTWPTVNFKVNVTTLNKLIQKYNVSKIDFLKIDIEGHDSKILYAYDFSVRPSKIKMEMKNMIEHPNKYGKLEDFLDYMNDNDYSFYGELWNSEESELNTPDVWFFDNLR